jgi:hypothetical protein
VSADLGAPPCPLCAEPATHPLPHPAGRFAECPRCALRFRDPAEHLRPLAEVTHYLTHDNRLEDPAYRAFLARLADPLCAVLRPGARGIDVGCGPVPALGTMLTERGFPTDSYDPFFAPIDPHAGAPYDFVSCSEAVEHAHSPSALFTLLGSLVSGGGVIAVMTRFYGEAPFATWWYPRDPTHVVFYDTATFRWIADQHGWTVDFPAPNIALFQVP